MNHLLPHYSFDSTLWLFEENYRLLLELLACDCGEGGILCSAQEEQERLEITILERSRYTLTVALRKSHSFGKEWIADLVMEARIYFDAQVAEVLAYQNCRRLPAPYAIKSSVPFHKDERRQANRLLNDLLEHCIRQGYRPLDAVA